MVEEMTASDLLGTTVGSAGGGVDWAEALARHDRWLRTVVLARLGERQAVDEVIQEVGLAAVAQRAPLSDPGKVSAWLYRLAIRHALLYRRRMGRRRALATRYAEASRARPDGASTVDPLDCLLRDERRRLVREALARLPGRDAELIILKYTEAWSYRELADHLGLTEAAVEARLHRARARLRRELGEAST
jgi:RNA polymerase sigma-70 factor (ECF subfamily)